MEGHAGSPRQITGFAGMDTRRGPNQQDENHVLTPIELLADVSRSFWMRGTVGLEPNEERIKEHLENSLMLVTAFQSARGPRKDDNDLPDSIPATSQPTRGFSQTRFRHGRAV